MIPLFEVTLFCENHKQSRYQLEFERFITCLYWLAARRKNELNITLMLHTKLNTGVGFFHLNSFPPVSHLKTEKQCTCMQ